MLTTLLYCRYCFNSWTVLSLPSLILSIIRQRPVLLVVLHKMSATLPLIIVFVSHLPVLTWQRQLALAEKALAASCLKSKMLRKPSTCWIIISLLPFYSPTTPSNCPLQTMMVGACCNLTAAMKQILVVLLQMLLHWIYLCTLSNFKLLSHDSYGPVPPQFSWK